MTGEWLRRKKNQYQQQKVRRVSATELTDDLRREIADAANAGEKPVYEIRPYQGDGGVRRAMNLLDGMHEIRRKWWFKNVTQSNLFEIAFDRGDLTFRFAPGSRENGRAFRDQLYEDYPNSELRQIANETPAFVDSEHTHIAAANGHLHRDAHIPIRHIDVDGFAYSKNASENRDPYRKVLTDLTTDDDATVWVQVAFRPTTQGWRLRRRIQNDARDMESGAYQWFFWKRPPHDHEQDAADTLRNQLNESTFQMAVRIVAAAGDADTAEKRVVAAANALSEYYESNLDQGIYFEPVGSALPIGGDAPTRRFLSDVAGRKATFNGAVATTSELAGLAHLPGEGVQNESVAWTKSKAGAPKPPGFPDFDFEEYGVDPELATPAEKWQAMLSPEAQEDGAPWWLGFGSRKGKPIGIYDDDYFHTGRGGETRYGKTESALHDFYQACARGHTAIYVDPKSGDDAKTAARYAMYAGRGDELYPIRLGGESDHQLGFNLMEVPGNPEVGTKRYGAGLEGMADIVEGALRQADAHSSGQWGSRMSRITRHLCRALGKLDLGHPPTPLTLYFAGTNREKYTERVDQEKITWLRDTARDVFAEYSDNEIEPWRGRMQQIIESDPLREMACLTSSLSFFDLFHDGGVVVIYAENTSKTAMKTLMSGFFPRAYREFVYQYRHPEIPDPPETHLFGDELNDIVTDTMDFPRMLSNGAGYGFHVHGIMQDYDSQAGDDVEQAFKGQARNITLNTGTPEFAQTVSPLHDDFGVQELTNLSKYTAVVRAHDKRNGKLGELHSVKAALGPPLHEINDDIPGVEAAEEHISEREQVAGEKVRTPEEIMKETPFSPEYDGDLFDSDDGIDVTEAVEQAAVQGVFDTAIRQGDPEGFIALDDAHDAVVRRLEELGLSADFTDDDDLWRQVIQHVDDDLLDSREDGTEYRATSPRSTLATVGEDQSAGGPGHAGIMWNAYIPLTWAGLDLTINDASGDDADALARPAPESEQNAPELVERLTGGGEARVESSHSTGRTKAGVDAKHVLQAANEGRRTIVLCRPGDAQNVANTLRENPRFARSDHTANGETRFYTDSGSLSVGGETMTRPGSRKNVWIRDSETGEITLKDDGGAVHARFEDCEAVFSDPEPYPSGGERTVTPPIIPEQILNDDAEVSEEIVTVPEGAESLDDLELVVGTDSLTVPADAVGQDDAEARADDLDVPDNASRLLELLREDGDGPWTHSDAYEIGSELNVSDKTIRNYLADLADEGVLEKQSGDYATAPVEYRLT